MNLEGVARTELVIGLVSDDLTLQFALAKTLKGSRDLAHVQLVHASGVGAASRNNADIVLVDCIGRISDHFALYAAIGHARRSGKPEAAYVGLIEDSQLSNAIGFAGGLGFDLVLRRDAPLLIFANSISLDRYRQAVARGSRTHLVQAAFVGEKIGPWQLIPLKRAVECPDGAIQKLTNAEWGFLDFLVQRDLTRIDIPTKLVAKMDANPRLNGLVYKIKKKLGEKFPIVSHGNGKYALAVKTAKIATNVQ